MNGAPNVDHFPISVACLVRDYEIVKFFNRNGVDSVLKQISNVSRKLEKRHLITASRNKDALCFRIHYMLVCTL